MTFLLLQQSHRMLLRHHERIGHLFVPNLESRIPNELGGYFVRTNAQGFRSNREFAAPRGERPRILFLGDSYLAGDNLANEERFSDLLGDALGAETYNYGLPGSGLDQALLIWEHFARDVQADLVVLAPSVDTIDRIRVSHRESIDRVTRKRVLVPKPWFELVDGELVLRQEIVPTERPEAGSADATAQGDTRAGERGIGALLEWYRKSDATRGLRELAPGAQAIAQSFLYRAARIQPYDDYRSAGSAGWRLLAAIFARLFEEVSPVPVLVVPIPANPFLTHRAEPIYQPLYEGLEDRARGVHVMDLTTPMTRGSWSERRSLSFRHDAHFSPEGHRLAAEIIAGEIRGRGLLPEPRAAQSQAERRADRRTRKPIRILGISAFYHDSAAALVEDGRIVAAAAEERFSRVKNDRRFPRHACNYALEEGGVNPADLDAVVYYDNASLTFERLLHSQGVAGDEGRDVWLRMLPAWVRYKLRLPELIRRTLHYEGPLLQEVHHRSHCASAFYPSPFDRAAILTVDGVGEWATASIARGEGREIELLEEMRFPNSLGLLYSAFTQFTGFKVNSGEYKMMGLAPYGKPRFVDPIREHLVEIADDGSLQLDLSYFDFLTRMSMTNEAFAELFDGPARAGEDQRITQREMDIARSIQVVTEECLLRMARHAREVTGEDRLCLAGGVAFNCVANGRLLREGPFEDLWIQPAAGDAGAALGAALDAYHTWLEKPREPADPEKPLQRGSYWGPSFSKDEIRAFLETNGYPHRELSEEERPREIAALLADGKVVGHLAGRMEFGPRALGARSILGDPRNSEMQATLNLKIKYRESFRPFAPSVLREKVGEYFDFEGRCPYMQLVCSVRKDRRLPFEQGDRTDLLEVVREPRSDIPAVTHVDYSARIQTVDRDDHPDYYDLIRAFEERTGTAVVVNTSFNVRGEPIVCTPDDAYRCFMRTEMDALVLGSFLLTKDGQPAWGEPKGHIEEEDAARELDRSDPLVRRLSKIFDAEFLPVARVLAAEGALQFEREPQPATSRWTAYAGPASASGIFEIPPELDGARPDPEVAAEAITRAWRPGKATDALRPLVARLLALGERYPLEEEEAGEVEDSVYVMF